MAYRKELCTAGLLLLLSLLQTNQSAPIEVTSKMEQLGQEALAYLETVAAPALKNHTGNHSVGCITEPKEHECLNCTLISTFSGFLQAASDFDGLDKVLRDKLRAVRQHLKDLRNAECGTDLKSICEVVFQKNKTYKNLTKVRSILVLYLQWIKKPMENC